MFRFLTQLSSGTGILPVFSSGRAFLPTPQNQKAPPKLAGACEEDAPPGRLYIIRD
ncbi:hypothetical protein [Iningainema tapete]|uniref:Uncharacterized protein n=1 Tax=Iningainema tapete BLCC-T55 TaxID=2748662 RepID=A0A8J6XX69_9CYAN|nr:hypothetical protein [Iningainema tapete]MBD2778012.1 hypothetical protein [Iningainema tapete BLCC-T55]